MKLLWRDRTCRGGAIIGSLRMGDGRLFALVAVPVLLALCLLVAVVVRNTDSGVSSLVNEYMTTTSQLDAATGTDDSCTECPDMITSLNCADAGIPVLGGVDFVQYFTDFKYSDGSGYNTSRIGQLGVPSFQTLHVGYQFNFISANNQALFEANPSAYLPQYGGFCSWGVSGEFCTDGYPWAADCLGPSGNWGHWTMYQDKLYFFYKAEAKEKFDADPEYYAAQGKLRWSAWFSESPGTEAYFSTQCFVSNTAGG